MNITTLKYVSDPVLEYKIGRTADIFDQHEIIMNAESIYCRYGKEEFDVTSVTEQIEEIKRIISSKYRIEKPLNFYAIIRTATTKERILEELSTIPDFFKDRNVSDENKIIRLGNIKNVVFYYCPVFTNLMKYHVDVGVKVKRDIIIPNFKTDSLAFTLEFNRNFTKDYRSTRQPLDYSKKKISEKTTEVMKKSDIPYHAEMTVEERARSQKELFLKERKKRLSEETTKIIGTPDPRFDITKLRTQESPIPPYNYTENFVPLHDLPITEQNRLKDNLKKNTEIELPKPVLNSSKGTNDISLTDKLRNEYKKIEENYDLIKQIENTCGESNNSGGGNFSPSTTVSDCEYDTKARAFENVGRSKNLPNAFISAVKGFYKKEANEIDKIRNLSDDAILTYKLGKILDYANEFKENNIYSKQECENLFTYRTTYVKHHFLYESEIPFILVNTDEVSFNFYGNKIEDKQQIQEQVYFSLRSLVTDLKEKVKDNILFVKKVSPDEYANTLTPSIKSRNEFKIKCYLLPKNKF
jgi:hypothetical protein